MHKHETCAPCISKVAYIEDTIAAVVEILNMNATGVLALLHSIRPRW
jgi:hypothetical protein